MLKKKKKGTPMAQMITLIIDGDIVWRLCRRGKALWIF